MEKVDAIRRFLLTDRPSRADIVSLAGVSPSCGEKFAKGVTKPKQETVEKFTEIAIARRAALLEELMLVDSIVAR
ncbi:hypothetical protein [Paraburkholderia sediminicola]|uniref:hypothetical protein n=1 Tax=Paraburkholderia sediminicola TaxID=458836 RepID=UPI0038B78D99